MKVPPWMAMALIAYAGLPLQADVEKDRFEKKEWRAAGGGFWPGTFVDVNLKAGWLKLKRPNGKTGLVALEKLSEGEQIYLRRHVERREELKKLGAKQVALEERWATTLSDDERMWASADGKKVAGLLESFDGDKAVIRTGRGMFALTEEQLSELDWRLLKKWDQQRPVQVGPWPEFVEVPKTLDIKVLEGREGDWPNVYRSPHFEFRTKTRLSASVVREFARVFEATYQVAKDLPVGFDPKPRKEGYFVTELYTSHTGYYEAGGPEGSGGVYMGGKDKIMIPLPNLGVRRVGNRWILEGDKDSSTLIHEIVHQVMRRWGGQWPVWFSEGIAEYISYAKYSKGRFSFRNMSGSVEDAVMTYPAGGKFFSMVDLKTLMEMDHSTWSSALTSGGAGYNYRSAGVLMYYFLHHDGNGSGSGVATFQRALSEGWDSRRAMAEHMLRGRTYEEIARDLEEKLKSAGFRVEVR
ncbi:MAG: DUF1570 domain-containing protein [Verrucomicrobiota bacterium]